MTTPLRLLPLMLPMLGQIMPGHLMCTWNTHAKPPFSPDSALNIQIIEFTYCNDRFPTNAIVCKLNKCKLEKKQSPILLD